MLHTHDNANHYSIIKKASDQKSVRNILVNYTESASCRLLLKPVRKICYGYPTSHGSHGIEYYIHLVTHYFDCLR